MSQEHCPNCGKDKFTDNGGLAPHITIHSIHILAEGLRHGSPLNLAMGAGGLAMRVLNPKKFTCLSCGHVFKAS